MGQKLLLHICFDGRGFCGYQAQQNGPSVQAEMTRAVSELFGHPCDVTGCSRTDSGVHARMFCCTVTTHGMQELATNLPTERIPQALCVRLPETLAVTHAQWVPSEFHPRYDVTAKEYIYRFLTSPYRDPFETGRSWHIPRPLLPEADRLMAEAAQGFVGRRDFAACMAAGSKIQLNRQSTVRHVSAAAVSREGNILTFRVRADGFLYNMVRIMAGTLFEVAVGRIPPDSIPARLDSLDRRQLGRTAPPEGLYLDRVFYDDPSHPGYHGGVSHAT